MMEQSIETARRTKAALLAPTLSMNPDGKAKENLSNNTATDEPV